MNRLQQRAAVHAAFMADCADRGMDPAFVEAATEFGDIAGYMDLGRYTRSEFLADLREKRAAIDAFLLVHDGE